MFSNYSWIQGSPDWYTQWHSIGENRYSIFQQISIANSFVASDGTLFLFVFPGAGICLVWSHAGFVWAVTVPISLCVWQGYSVQKKLFPWRHPPSLTLISFPSLLHGFFSLKVKELIDIPFGAKFSRVEQDTDVICHEESFYYDPVEE